MIRRHLKAGLLLLGLAPAAAALDTDRQQPISIKAERVTIDERRGVSTYSGAVEMRQGSLTLEADKVEVRRKGESMDSLRAEGRPARFSQLPEGRSEKVIGEAQRIDYITSEGIISLRGEALLRQDGDRFSGESIDYDLRRDHIQAEGGESGRVEVLFLPPKDTENDDE